jgi:predicted GNAT family N-acyltransferase
LIEKAKKENLKRLRLMARISASGFYKRLGFFEMGDPFDYLDIPHIFMSSKI